MDLNTQNIYQILYLKMIKTMYIQGIIILTYLNYSDQVENSDIIQSLLPCYHTHDHCIIIPHSQIPPVQ